MNTPNGRRISKFITTQTIPDTAFISYIDTGTNFKISKADFLTALGVTGTLEQLGDPLAAPVLSKSGTVNRIRNIESGPGIKASVSATEGVLIEHNFEQNAGGVAITSDLTNDMPKFLALVAGAGMQISSSGGLITFTNTGTDLPATKAVAINQESDFPEAVGGVITLEPDTVYIISNDVTTENRFVRQNNTSVVGYSELGPTLEYTGTGAMFTSVDSSTLIQNLRVSAPNGSGFDWSDTTGNSKTDTLKNVRIGAVVDIGQWDSGQGLIIEECSSLATTGTGVKVLGTGWLLLAIDGFGVISSDSAFVGVDYGTAELNATELNNLVFLAPLGAVGVTGLPNGGNITVNNLGNITGCSFLGDMTPITGIDPVSDIRWESLGNDGIGDSRSDSLVSIQGNATETIINAIGIPVAMAGAWTDIDSSRFSVTANGGRITYIGERDARLPIGYTASLLFAGGGDKQVSAYIAVNGAIIPGTRIETTASSSKTGTVTLIWQYEFKTGDYMELFVANEDNTENIIVQSSVARID